MHALERLQSAVGQEHIGGESVEVRLDVEGNVQQDRASAQTGVDICKETDRVVPFERRRVVREPDRLKGEVCGRVGLEVGFYGF